MSRLRRGANPSLEIRPRGQNPYLFASLHPAIGAVTFTDAATIHEVKARLGTYANTGGCEVIAGSLPAVERIIAVILQWPAEQEEEAQTARRAFLALADVATRVEDRWFLQPLLGTSPAAPCLLLNWWAVLIALSSLARYEPAKWTSALDVDHEGTAVELERVLAIAEVRVPELISSALHSAWTPLSRALDEAEDERAASSADPAP